MVVSINANRGITCGQAVEGDSGLNLARGRLVLRHLTLLTKWNKEGGAPSSLGTNLKGKIDFSRIGMLGHSRGGEGVRAAYNIYNDSDSIWPAQMSEPLNFRAIFEIGPVDGQTSRVLNANGLAWNVILPMCDGDVSNLEGMKPYDRMIQDTTESPALPKSMFAVWGADHDFYNTEWQTNDSPGCVGSTPLWSGQVGSAKERQTASLSVVPFFRDYLGSNPASTLAGEFNPLNPLNSTLTAITRVDRSFTLTPNSNDVVHLENFQAASGTGSSGQPEITNQVTATHTSVPEHDPSLMAAELTWSAASPDTYYQDNFTASGSGITLPANSTLDFRLSRADSSSNPSGATNFYVELVFSDGSLSKSVAISNYLSLVGPIGISGDLHETLPTARIPVDHFVAAGSAQSSLGVQGIRFVFSDTASGDIFLSDIDLSRYEFASQVPEASAQVVKSSLADEIWANIQAQFPILSWATPKLQTTAPAMIRASSALSNPLQRNTLLSARKARDGTASSIIEVESSDLFRARDALLVLRLNGQEIAPGSFSTTGDLHTMNFKITSAQFAKLPSSLHMEVGYREGLASDTRDFGTIDKSQLIGN